MAWNYAGLILALGTLSGAPGAAEAEPGDCVRQSCSYRRPASEADREPELSSVPECGCIRADGSLTVFPEHLANLSFHRDGLAVIRLGTGGIAYVNPDGKTAWVYPFDNGPDYFVEGLARTPRDSKIGFINEQLDVVIEPAWDFAFPFEGGFAVVCEGCEAVPACPACEHREIAGGRWGYIDRRGRIAVPVSHARDVLPPRPAPPPDNGGER